ncbi:hypothetical protein [Laspinema olomoucense]|uniref:hypothetical protein n=1 Tax=Laspinema olomoucense TaxID=3231600 RepID=UPI0021BAFDFD|nr:hypothetical protein [Laspinema sp. D3c]MCT7993578.1 hypothetical protein [Laspinema sp. D3c]
MGLLFKRFSIRFAIASNTPNYSLPIVPHKAITLFLRNAIAYLATGDRLFFPTVSSPLSAGGRL